jgi:uncharacterized RDD family membrane protein YckC
MNWYYVNGAGQQAGPLDDAAFDALIASGGINMETLVWREGMANWQPLREVRPQMGDMPEGSPPVLASGGQEVVCSQCGGVFPMQDTIQVGNARVCANCKPVFVQKMREGLSVEQAGMLRYAGFWTRFAARFLDGILLGIVNNLINFAFGMGIAGISNSASPSTGLALLPFVALFINLFICMTYETLMIGKFGATLGKMACKIRVVMPDGGKVSYPRSLGRYFSTLVSTLTCFVGFIMAAFDGEKRALHDRICDTRVVFK